MDLIYIKHPKEEMQKNQANFLASLAEKEKIHHALLFNYGNAAYRYHTSVEPTEEEYFQWLEGLPEDLKAHFTREGFENSKTVASLTRFVQEIRDNGMDEYMKRLLKPEDFERMKEQETKFME